MNDQKSRCTKALPALLVSCLLVACGDDPNALLLSAKDYLARRDTQAAVIQIKNALQANPSLAEARFLLGTTLLDTGDPLGAETELRKALDLNYPPERVIPPLAQALLAQGQSRQVTQAWAATTLNSPAAQASLQMSLSTAYATQGLHESSQAALAAALRADPSHAPALMAQARQKAQAQDLDGALALVQDVIERAPESHEAWKLKGDLLLYGKQQVAQALAAYRKAVDIRPDFLAGQVALATVLLQQGDFTQAEAQLTQVKRLAPKHPHTHFLVAQWAYQNKDFKQARDEVQQTLKADPAHVLGLQLAGAVALQLQALAPAETYLNRALQLAPSLALARRLLVMTYLRSGQADKAVAALLPGLAQVPVDPQLWSVAGEVYLQSGDLKQAEHYFTKAAQQAPDDGRNRTSVALTRLMRGEVDAAFDALQDIAASDAGISADLALINAHLRRRAFDQALNAIDGLEKKQPKQPLAAQLRGRTLLAQQDVVGARKSFEQALALAPTYFAAVVSLASLDMAEKQPEQARKRFETLLALDPHNSRAFLALAELSVRSGATPEEVVRLLDRAVQANPDDAGARLALVDFYLGQQDAKAALSAAQQAVAALPENAEVLLALGRAQQAAGAFNQAMATYNQLASLQPRSGLPYVRMAEVHMADKSRELAVRSLRRALQVQPDLLEAQRALVMLDLEAGKFQDALTTARTVQRQRPQAAPGFILEGDSHAFQKQWAAAATAYRAGLKQVRAPELALKLHTALLASDQQAAASQWAATWQKDHPKDAVFLQHLGDQALARRDYGHAEKMYTAVIGLQPRYAMAYNNLAVLFSERGDYAKALAWQHKTLALQPQNALFKLNLAKIHLRGGQPDLAKPALNELSQLGHQFAAHAEVAALLKGL